MKKTSWVILGVCALLCAGLSALYFLTQNAPKTFAREDAIRVVEKLQASFHSKRPGEIMSKISPDSEVKLAKLTPDQVHAMLMNYFRNSDTLNAETSSYAYTEGQEDNTLQKQGTLRGKIVLTP